MGNENKGTEDHSVKISVAKTKGRPPTFSTQELRKLRMAIRTLRYHHPLFALLKDELSNLGYWRALPRGNPSKGYAVAHGEKKDGAVDALLR